MITMKYIFEKLKNNETIYLHYDFEDVVVRLVPFEDDYVAIAKFKGAGENEYPKNADLIYETEMRGEIITKEQYDLYGLNEEEIEIEDNSKNCNKTKQKDEIVLAPHFTKEELEEMKVGGMQKVILDLQLGRRKPKNKEEEELLKEIRDAEAKGQTLHLPLE